MKKFIIFIFFIMVFLVSTKASADIEAIQPVIEFVRGGIKQATYVSDTIGEIKKEIRSAAEGITGPISTMVSNVQQAKATASGLANDVNGLKNMASDPTGATLGAIDNGGLSLPGFSMPDFTIPSFVSDVEDEDKTSLAIKKNVLLQNEGDDKVKLFLQQQAITKAMERENFAKMYALAFTIRTNLAKERLEEKKDTLGDCSDSGGQTSTRCLKLAVREKSDSHSRRLGHIWALESASMEFTSLQYATQYKINDNEETGD